MLVGGELYTLPRASPLDAPQSLFAWLLDEVPFNTFEKGIWLYRKLTNKWKGQRN